MARRLLFLLIFLVHLTVSMAIHRQWSVNDGLPTGEIHQIIELPNRQILVNCEGAFCLFDGKTFNTITCDHRRCPHMPHFAKRYIHLWQGDSLLWLHDLYRLYLFDARTCTFRYDIEPRLKKNHTLQEFADGNTIPKPYSKDIRQIIDSLRLHDNTTAAKDWQGGIWIGTRTNDIIYISPLRTEIQISKDEALFRLTRSMTDSQGRSWICSNNGLFCHTGKETECFHMGNTHGLTHNNFNFIAELPDHRFLVCHNLNQLGYLDPEHLEFTSLRDKIPALGTYRHLIGACSIAPNQTIVYSQNGAFLLDTRTDTISAFPFTEAIEKHSYKYNCMLLDAKGILWIGTQNGLFAVEKENCRRIRHLANHCIRSLVADANGNIWAGTACGISRITPYVINYGPDDGMPTTPMLDRAGFLKPDSTLVFSCSDSSVVTFRPEHLSRQMQPLSVVLTAISVNDEPYPVGDAKNGLSLSYNQNYLTFRFSALNYATPSHTRYRYRLHGLENKWNTYADTDGSLGIVTYRALSPGTYTFEVQAAIDNDSWGPLLQQDVVIRPPFWLTWWAKAIYIMAFLLTLSVLLHSYLKKKKARLEHENDNRVNRLFELREEARHQFAESTNIDPQRISVNNEEEEFVKRMLHAIENHLDDDNYGVDQLAADVCMSRSALYTRLRNMLGITPSDFIRNIRLKHAAQLLSDTQIPINDIASRVGYNTHKAFATNFKKLFGCLPSEYRGNR